MTTLCVMSQQRDFHFTVTIKSRGYVENWFSQRFEFGILVSLGFIYFSVWDSISRFPTRLIFRGYEEVLDRYPAMGQESLTYITIVYFEEIVTERYKARSFLDSLLEEMGKVGLLERIKQGFVEVSK